MRAFGLGERTALDFPDETPGILEAVAGVGGHREVHRRLRPGRRQQPDPAGRGRQHDRQRRHVRRAEAGRRRRSTPTARCARCRPSETHEVVRPEVAEQMQRMMREVVCRGHGQAGPGARAVDRRQDRHRLHRPARRRLRQRRTARRPTTPASSGSCPAEDPQVTILVSIDQPPRRQRATASAARPRRRCSASWRRR